MKQIRIYNEREFLKNLQTPSLYIDSDFEGTLDLSLCDNLLELNIRVKNYQNLHKLDKIEFLSIANLKKEETKEISQLTTLTKIHITHGNIEELDFLKNLSNLEELELNYLSKLNDISRLEELKKSLSILDIDSCKNIKSFETIANLTNLESLGFISMKLNNINFINGCKKLTKLMVIDSNILSGDLSPAKSLDWVSFDNKRHYNYIFNSDENKIYQKKENSKKRPVKTSSFKSFPHFGKIDITTSPLVSEATILVGERNVNLELEIEEGKVESKSLALVRSFLKNDIVVVQDNLKSALKSMSSNEMIQLYHDFIKGEFENQSTSTVDFIANLFIQEIRFYPQDDEIVIIDLVPAELEIDHVLCIKLNKDFEIVDIVVES